MSTASLFFAFIALLLWGISGITQKLSTNRISSELSFLWFTYAMAAISGTLILSVPMHWHHYVISGRQKLRTSWKKSLALAPPSINDHLRGGHH